MNHLSPNLTHVHGENWCMQKQECPFNPSPQAKEMSINKVPTLVFTKDIVTRSPSNKRPRTTQGPQPKWQRTLLKKWSNPLHNSIQTYSNGKEIVTSKFPLPSPLNIH
jgi:hypothetical protein